MTRFQDHLKAEIFAETFSKIFFSGSAGRAVAIVFAVAYAAFFTAFGILSFFVGIVFKTISAGYGAYRKSRFHVRRKTYRNLKRSIRKFGDRMEIREGNGWTAYEIAGNGLRTGSFRIALAHHRTTGAVRIFRSSSERQEELENAEIRALLTDGAVYARLEDFPLVYRNLKTHVLWKEANMKRVAALAFAALAVSGCSVSVRPSEKPVNAPYYETAGTPVFQKSQDDSVRLEKQRKIRALLRDIRGDKP